MTASAEASVTRQSLRTFHISGHGLPEAAPRGPLRPVELDELPDLPRLEAEYPIYVSPQFECKPLAEAFPGAGIAIQARDLVTAAEIGSEGWLVPFTANALPLLYAATVSAVRRAARERFLDKVARQAGRLEELLQLDDSCSPAGSSPEAISGTFGTETAYLDSEVLASALNRKTKATRQMDPVRRRRIEGILSTLNHGAEDARREPAFWMFHSATAPANATAFGGQLRQCGDSFEAALEFCDQRLERFARVLRALRAAKLEVETAFDPDIHEEWLHRFDWQSASPEELAALPAFVVLEPAEWLARTSFASFGRLLRSGRPVHVLAPCRGLGSGDEAGDLSGFMPDFGYLAIAYREAFVLQSSLSSAAHLMVGLRTMAQSPRPGVAVVSVPSEPSGDWLASSLLHLSRAFPLYRYNPDRGESWMERFELAPGTSRVPLTAAHAVAVSDEYRNHFRVIPESAWDEEQMELTEYLAQYRNEPPLAEPYLWVVDGQGTRQRAIVTRELVNLCRDRFRAYRVFEELAGVGNAHVEAAVLKTRQEVQDKVRIEGATAAIYRVVAMLANGQTIMPVQPTALARHDAAPDITPQEPASVQSSSEDSAEAYIESFLCTSCNDCMKINAQVFLYDANKQAYIGNARAGTFAELVKAAEGCPGKCIHPGSPRADDKTATQQMLARAAKLN